ncbi:hypothetical protein BDL97_10G030800 [Sphagnum fallax]|jgi:hypothetical protein|uniref:Dof-type domain-containing protein n=1 Tax=Sphagnum jensenii TaxID=128206 RepID=A0ABP1A9R9_9BRYO|nr:hypothetical protein BDL97_10G030800 [Sphagnum fallax]
MAIMHLRMNHCREDLDPDVIHQGSGDSASPGDQHSPGSATRGSGGCMRERPVRVTIPCPRCQSMNTKFCYYNNYSVNQPRYFCRNCQRYWTEGGTLRNVPVGGGSRKKVRTRQRSDWQLQSHDSPAALLGAGLVNMTLQPNFLQIPNTIQMASTQQRLSMFSQMTGDKLGSFSNRFLLQSGLNEIPPNTMTPHLPTFLQLSSSLEPVQIGNSAGGLSKNPAAAATTGLMSLQDNHMHSTLHSAMYELQSTSMPTNSSMLQLGGGNIHAGFSNETAGGYNHYTPAHQKLESSHIEFLSSVMQKPAGYWGVD